MVSPTFTIQMTNVRGSAWPEVGASIHHPDVCMVRGHFGLESGRRQGLAWVGDGKSAVHRVSPVTRTWWCSPSSASVQIMQLQR